MTRPTVGRAISILLIIAASLQAIYLHLDELVPITEMIACSAILIGIMSIQTVGAHLHRMKIDVVLGMVLCGYTLVISSFYYGESLANFVLTPLTLLLFYFLLMAIRAHPSALLFTVKLTPYFVMSVGIVHFIAILSHSSLSQGIPLGAASLRYGYQDGTNLINITGANIALVALSGYLFTRFAANNVFERATALTGSALLLLPLLATQSRAAALMLLASVAAAEILRGPTLRKATRVRLLVLVAILVSIGAYAQTDGPMSRLASTLMERFGDGYTSGDTARTEALDLAFNSGMTLFGAFREGSSLSVGARDNTFANFVLSYGLVGFLLATTFFLSAVFAFGRAFGASKWFIIAGATPALMRSLGEGGYVTTSSLFCLIIYLCVLTIAFRPKSSQLVRRCEIGIKRSGASIRW